MLSDGTAMDCIPETDSFIQRRACKERSIWRKGKGIYPAGVTCPRFSDLFPRVGVPTANRFVVRRREEFTAVV